MARCPPLPQAGHVSALLPGLHGPGFPQRLKSHPRGRQGPAWPCVTDVTLVLTHRGDWLLSFVYRTSSVQLRVAGLQPVLLQDRRMENVDLSLVVSIGRALTRLCVCLVLGVGHDITPAQPLVAPGDRGPCPLCPGSRKSARRNGSSSCHPSVPAPCTSPEPHTLLFPCHSSGIRKGHN